MSGYYELLERLDKYDSEPDVFHQALEVCRSLGLPDAAAERIKRCLKAYDAAHEAARPYREEVDDIESWLMVYKTEEWEDRL